MARIKQLGREVSGYDDHVWNGMRQAIVYEGLMAKFSQNEDLKTRLIATGNTPLTECAVRDRIWGIGLSMTDPRRFDRTAWRGQNLMGYSLMLVRDRLLQQFVDKIVGIKKLKPVIVSLDMGRQVATIPVFKRGSRIHTGPFGKNVNNLRLKVYQAYPLRRCQSVLVERAHLKPPNASYSAPFDPARPD